ncbi:MAG: ATP-binding cassette domain-containing protein [Bacteroidales bacterium]|nr:ATP-binding cassette domain-containing protein [Candidatus Cacconaster merdequi]
MGKRVRSGTFAFLSKHMQGFDEAVMLVGAVSLLLIIPKVASPVITQILVDNVLPGLNPEWAGPLIAFATLIVCIEVALRFLEATSWRHRLRMSITSANELFWHTLRLPVGYFHDKYAGDLVSRIYYGKTISKKVIDNLLWAAGDMVLIVFYLFFMIKYSLFLSLFAILHIILNIVILRLIHKKRVAASRKMQSEIGNLQGFTTAAINNIDAIKGATAEQDYFRKWSEHFTKMQNAVVDCTGDNIRTETIPLMMEAVSNVLVLGFGVYYIMQGYLTAGMLMTFQSFMTASMRPMSHITNDVQELADVQAQVERMEDVLSADCDVPGTIESVDGIEKGKLSGEVELRNVTFGYDRNAAPLITDFNLKLSPGKSVAFVGPSGCGKSTIAKLVSGLYQPWSGEVLFDGKLQSEINRDVFANSVAIVDQNIVLFDGTISENVKLWDDSTEDFAMILACHDAQIHEEIVVRDGNYEASVECGGKNFSGGQRQRLELATAFAKEPSVMIMDEGTSALDAVTEELVMRNIRNMGCSQIIIAHRLSTIRDCDEIIVLKQGKVVERGNHDQLMALNGFYSQLVDNK